MFNKAYTSLKYFFSTLLRGTLAGISAALLYLGFVSIIRLINLTVTFGELRPILWLEMMTLIPPTAMVGTIIGTVTGIPFALYLSRIPSTNPNRVRQAIQCVSIIIAVVLIWSSRYIFFWVAYFKGEPGTWWMSAILLLVGALSGYLGGYVGWRSWFQSITVKVRRFDLFQHISLPD